MSIDSAVKLKSFPGISFVQCKDLREAKKAILANRMVVSCYCLAGMLYYAREVPSIDAAASTPRTREIPGYANKAKREFYAQANERGEVAK